MPAQVDSFPATSRLAARVPGPAGLGLLRFSLSRLLTPQPTSSAGALPVSVHQPGQPTPGLQTAGSGPGAPSNFPYLSRAARGSGRAPPLTRAPTVRAPVAPFPTRGRTT